MPQSEEEQESFLTSPEALTKYKVAGDIAQRSLAQVLAAAKEGALALDLCKLGDDAIAAGVRSVYNKKRRNADGKDVEVRRGIAFPTCVSVGSCVCHFAPLPSDPQATVRLPAGSLVRVELGVHIDGYIAQLAATVAVGGGAATGRQADVLAAAHTAAEAALRQFKPGRTNWDVTNAVARAAAAFDCRPVEGMSCYQIARDLLDGEKLIPLNPTDEQRKEIETYEFEAGDAFTVDILMSTGDGRTRAADERTTLFRRTEQRYELKMKASRAVFSEIDKKGGRMVFNLRSLDDERRARMGIVECVNHGLVIPYAVVHERDDDAHLAHLQFTVLVTPRGPVKVANYPWDAAKVKSERKIEDPELKRLLNEAVKIKG